MDNDKQVVQTADEALVAATRKYLAAQPWEQAQIADQLDQARNAWARARYRLLLPDTVSTESDVAEAAQLKSRIEAAVQTQQLVDTLGALAALLAKFAF